MLKVLTISGLLLYTVNYVIGWLLFFKKISISKKTHQVFFISIIINLALILFFLKFPTLQFALCSASLVMMLILPFGRKGGIYHRITGTLGVMLYIICVFLIRYILLN